VLAMSLRGRRATEVIVADDPDTGEVLGCVTFVLAGRPWAEVARDGEGEFRMLAVAPGAQGRGFGSALVRPACLERAVAEQAPRYRSARATRPSETIGMYERFGFVRIPDRDWTPEPDIKLLALRTGPATAGVRLFIPKRPDRRSALCIQKRLDRRSALCIQSAWTDGRRCVFKSAWTDGRRCVFKSAWTDGRRVVEAAVKGVRVDGRSRSAD